MKYGDCVTHLETDGKNGMSDLGVLVWKLMQVSSCYFWHRSFREVLDKYVPVQGGWMSVKWNKSTSLVPLCFKDNCIWVCEIENSLVVTSVFSKRTVQTLYDTSRRLISVVFVFLSSCIGQITIWKQLILKMVPVQVFLVLQVWAPSSGAMKYCRSRFWQSTLLSSELKF